MTIYLIRHAHAGTRAVSPNDHRRQLSKVGHREAHNIAQQLQAAPIDEIWSSPLVRCQQTVQPLANQISVPIKTTAALAEGAQFEEGIVLIERLVVEQITAVLCSHGDVIPDVLAGLARRGTSLDHRDACEKASIWVLETKGHFVISGTYLRPKPIE